nr:elongation factor-like GTPase 1 [Tanacetum cinerariifolium]
GKAKAEDGKTYNAKMGDDSKSEDTLIIEEEVVVIVKKEKPEVVSIVVDVQKVNDGDHVIDEAQADVDGLQVKNENNDGVSVELSLACSDGQNLPTEVVNADVNVTDPKAEAEVDVTDTLSGHVAPTEAQEFVSKNARLSDVCIGTSADPTYFSPNYFVAKDTHGSRHVFDLIDGEVAANNPLILPELYLGLVPISNSLFISTANVISSASSSLIDRLILELKLTPLKAYAKLLRIVHEVNGIVSTYKSEKYLSDVDSIIQYGMGEMEDERIEFIKDDEEDTFQLQKGNVMFACALDGWGFGICEFADFYAKRVAPRSKARPMFVQFVLESLWQVYEATLDTNGDKGILEKLIKSFNLPVLLCELQNKDPKSFRISRLLPKQEILDSDVGKSDVTAEAELVRKSFEACYYRPESPCVAFISKMFAVPIKMLLQQDVNGDIVNNYHEESESGDSDECFLAFERVLSGVIYAGQKVFVLSALYDPLKTSELVQKHIHEAELHSLYLMMGRGLKPVATAHAGNIVSPTLKMAVEPSDPVDMAALMKGLRLLNRADPFVEISVSARGEHVLAAIGEVHLERCIKDLKD